MTWKAIQVPTGVNDKISVKPVMEGTEHAVMEAFGKWKAGNNEGPLRDTRGGIVIHDEKGRTRYAASRSQA
jgi:hypothetical protein